MSATQRTSKSSASRPALLNLPNQLTIARLVLSVVLFVAMSFERYGWSLALFVVAASTDWLDGFLARRYGWVTTLGRILDPFADKIIICGTFIFLVAVRDEGLARLGMHAWIVVVIVGRELLITALRSFLEQQGRDFSASMSGKLKMVAQCAAAVFCLVRLAFPVWAASPTAAGWFDQSLTVSLWLAAGLTVYSGVAYVIAATKMVRE